MFARQPRNYRRISRSCRLIRVLVRPRISLVSKFLHTCCTIHSGNSPVLSHPGSCRTLLHPHPASLSPHPPWTPNPFSKIQGSTSERTEFRNLSLQNAALGVVPSSFPIPTVSLCTGPRRPVGNWVGRASTDVGRLTHYAPSATDLSHTGCVVHHVRQTHVTHPA